MEPLRPFFDTLYMDVLSIICSILGILVFRSNMRYARNGLPVVLRRYLALKGFVALFVSIVYALTLFNVFDPTPPPILTRTNVVLLLFLMATDVLVRDDDANRLAKLLAIKKQLDIAEADRSDDKGISKNAPQTNAEVPKDA